MSVVYTFAFYLFIFIFSAQIVSAYNRNPHVLEVAPHILQIFFMGMSIFGVQMATQTMFMSLGQSLFSLLMALLRKVILLIPLAYILPRFIGLNGLFLAELIADFTATIITFATYKLTNPRIYKKRLAELDFDKSAQEAA